MRQSGIRYLAYPGVRVNAPHGLDHLLIFGRRHLEHILTEFIDHYHLARPHQGLGQRPPCPSAELIILADGGHVIGDDRLGGLIHGYRRAA